MPSQIDFAIAVGLFITFIVILFLYLTGYMSTYTGLISTSELRTVAYNIYNSLFGSKGIPESWEQENYTPIKVGLITDLVKVPVTIEEIYSRSFTNLLVPVENLKLDTHVWNSTVRIYDEDENEVQYDFDEQYFDSDDNVKEMSVSFLTNLTANQEKKFYIYGSQDKAIQPKNYTVNGWWNDSYRYRKSIVLVEGLGQDRSNELTSKHIVFDKDCESRTINTSLRVVDDSNQSISHSLSNTVYCTGSYLKEGNVSFNVTISANDHTAYWIYYNPVIPLFEDGFESGYGPWEETIINSPNTLEVVSEEKYQGSNSSKATRAANGGTWAVSYKTGLGSNNYLYLRAYVRVKSGFSLDTDNRAFFLVVLNNGGEVRGLASVRYDGTNLQWRHYAWFGSGTQTSSDLQVANVDQWYLIEIYYKRTDLVEESKMWIDGTLASTLTGTNPSVETINYIRTGFYDFSGLGASDTITAYIDDVKVAHVYIGPEI